jgi:zinc protease
METKIRRNIAPEFKQIENIGITKPEKILLDNGIPVYLINSGSEEIISFELIFDAGSWYEDVPLVSAFTNKMMTEGGTKQYTAFDISEKFEYYGASLDSIASKDTASIILSSLNKYSEQLIPLLSSIIYEPSFSEKEIGIHVNNAKHEHIINLEKPNYIATKKILELIYGDKNPYGHFEKKDDFDKINSLILKEFHENHYLNNSFSIIACGKIPSNFIATINKYFGQNKVKSNNENYNKYSFEYNNIVEEVINKEGAVQDSLRLGKLISTNSERHKLKVLSTILGGYFGSRLMKNIREEKGLTYGIYSLIQNLRNISAIIIIAETLKGKGQLTAEEVYKEFEILKVENVKEEELNLVKNYLLGELQRSFDGPLASAEMYKFLIKNCLDENFYDDYFKTILNINAEEIKKIANKYLKNDSFSKLIVTE